MSKFLFIGLVMLLLSGFLGYVGLSLYLYEKVYLVEYLIYEWSYIELKYEMVIDWVSVLYLGAVLLISGSVMIYSEDYMKSDINKDRFCLLSLMFVLSMGLMVMSSGLISVMVGWDGLGVVSYCLVIYYSSKSSYKSGMITISSNRVGDVFLLVSIGWLLYYEDWNYWFLGYENGGLSWSLVMMLVLAACTKSAQIPFSAWLPEAMAAPTPVSCLVHSSTLVTAGVFLMIRFHYLFEGGEALLMSLSLMTMLLAGSGALLEMDMKKVVAMSTLSQLGLMMFCVSIGLWKLAYFHMLIHAFFKALMFMSVGGVIHGINGAQDFRFIDKNLYKGVILNQGLLVSVFCLSGFPFFCGFFSKDLLLEVYSMSEKSLGFMMIFFFGFMMSVIYGMRLFMSGMMGSGTGMAYSNFCENQWMSVGIFLLMIMSVLSGSSLSWSLMFNYTIILWWFWKVMGLLFMLYFMVMGFLKNYYSQSYNKEEKLFFLKKYLGSMWFFSVISGGFWVEFLNKFEIIEMSDQLWLEELGVMGFLKYIVNKVFMVHEKSEKLNYFKIMMFFVLILFIYTMFL